MAAAEEIASLYTGVKRSQHDGDFDNSTISVADQKWSVSYGGRKIMLNWQRLKDPVLCSLFKSCLASKWRSLSPLTSLNYLDSAIVSLNAEHGTENFNIKSVEACWSKHLGNKRDFIIRASLIAFYNFLIKHNFPGTSVNDGYRFEDWPIAKSASNSSAFYELDRIIEPLLCNFIQRGLILDSISATDLSDQELQESLLFGILFFCGCRPIQIQRLSFNDILPFDDSNPIRMIRIPYAKNTSNKIDRIKIRLDSTVSKIADEFIRRKQGKSATRQLFERKNGTDLLIDDISSATTNTLQRFNQRCPSFDNVPKVSPYDLRHNVGHSLAMRGASSEQIAYVLGHRTIKSAKHYISATPELARLKLRAIGQNKAWVELIGATMTGKIQKLRSISYHQICGYVGGEFVNGLGQCLASACPFTPLRSCYGCKNFQPSVDGPHSKLRRLVVSESETVCKEMEKTGRTNQNPFCQIYEGWLQEIDSVTQNISENTASTSLKST